MKKKQLQSSLLLLLTAMIWGTAFVAQSVAMDYIEPFTFNAIRFLLGIAAAHRAAKPQRAWNRNG